MTLLLFIRPFPARAVVFPKTGFPKGGFLDGAEISGITQQMKEKKSRERRSGRKGWKHAY
jgi:hypothetical protein